MRILIVEDDAAGRFLLHKFLEPLGEIETANDGKTAVEVFESAFDADAPFHLVFLDIVLPKLDGQDALKKMRKIEKERGVTHADAAKVVITTALGDPNNLLNALHEGHADSYLVKPIDHVKLMQELEKIGVAVDA